MRLLAKHGADPLVTHSPEYWTTDRQRAASRRWVEDGETTALMAAVGWEGATRSGRWIITQELRKPRSSDVDPIAPKLRRRRWKRLRWPCSWALMSTPRTREGRRRSARPGPTDSRRWSRFLSSTGRCPPTPRKVRLIGRGQVSAGRVSPSSLRPCRLRCSSSFSRSLAG